MNAISDIRVNMPTVDCSLKNHPEAVKKGSYDMVSALLKHKASLDQPCAKRWSAMHEAAKQGRKDLVALLLKHGGNVHLRDGFGTTPLGVAAEFGHCDVLEHLIHKGTFAQLRSPGFVLPLGFPFRRSSRAPAPLLNGTGHQALLPSPRSPQ